MLRRIKSFVGLLSSDRFQVLLIGLIFLIPLLAAFLWEPTEFVNTGELVRPARPVADLTLRTPDGEPFRFSELKSKWTLFYLRSLPCGDDCAKSLYNMRQVRLAQGKNATRVQYVFLVTGGDLDRVLADVRQAHPNMLILKADEASRAALEQQFSVSGQGAVGSGRIYVVDPLGNLMMTYPPGADPAGMNRDLARLLRVSRIG